MKVVQEHFSQHFYRTYWSSYRNTTGN